MRTSSSANRSAEKPKYWFSAKQYGWGWGLPTAWQGWLVLALYLGGLILATVFGDERAVYICLGVLTLLLLVVCVIKGEPPRWRWGGRD